MSLFLSASLRRVPSLLGRHQQPLINSSTRTCTPGAVSSLAVDGRNSSSTTAAPKDREQQPPPPDVNDAATVVQGPSLLTSTSVHRPSPSLFHLPGLRSLPFWTAPSSSGGSSSKHRVAYNDATVSSIVSRIEDAYQDIRSEYLSAVLGAGTSTDLDADSVSTPLEPDYDVNAKGGEHASDALHTGTWDWHSYVLNGQTQPNFARRCPRTAAVVDALRDDGLLFETPFSFCFFSTLQGRSSIKAHVGPMNLRLRVHLPLIVPGGGPEASPPDGKPGCGLRVGSQIREWEEGRALVLDDSYSHEVWNNTDSVRVLLLLDVWHPDVAPMERARIRNMFEYARGKGWIGKKGGGG